MIYYSQSAASPMNQWWDWRQQK